MLTWSWSRSIRKRLRPPFQLFLYSSPAPTPTKHGGMAHLSLGNRIVELRVATKTGKAIFGIVGAAPSGFGELLQARHRAKVSRFFGPRYELCEVITRLRLAKVHGHPQRL